MSEEIVQENVEVQNSDDEDHVNMEEVSAPICLEALEKAWINEKFAPEILPHKSKLLGYMMTNISHMENNIRMLKKGDIRITIHTMELNRIRFIISSYLRKRLEKIENYVMQILSEEIEKINQNSKDLYLTNEERKFAQEYLVNFETLFQTLGLQHMPEVGNLSTFDVEKFSVKPNLHAHVFLKANKDISGIMVPGTMDEEVDFEEGSQHIIQYRAVAELLKRGDVQLI